MHFPSYNVIDQGWNDWMLSATGRLSAEQPLITMHIYIEEHFARAPLHVREMLTCVTGSQLRNLS